LIFCQKLTQVFEMFLNSAQNLGYVRGGGVLKRQIKSKKNNSTVKTTTDSTVCATDTISFTLIPFKVNSPEFIKSNLLVFCEQHINKPVIRVCATICLINYVCRLRASSIVAEREAIFFTVNATC
jgi:hypothetical protein